MAQTLKEKRPITGIEAIAVRPDGSRVPFTPYPVPLFDDSGNLTGGVNMLVEISGRQEAADRLAAIVESSDDAILAKDLNGVITSWNKGAERLFGYREEEVIGKPVLVLFPPERYPEEEEILGRIRQGERVEHFETVRRRKDGSLVEISLTVSPVKDAQGRIAGASKIARDITERKRAEEQQHLLLREMNHRVKNLFTLAASLVVLSARNAQTPQALAKSVQERLAALARAHELTLTKPAGDAPPSGNGTTLHALIDTILLPFENGEEAGKRVAIEGPDIRVEGSAVTSLGLLLHELATNAAKYGALSVPAGRLAIECSQNDGYFILDWTETGGPVVEPPSESNGFGSLLLRTAARHQLGGDFTCEWRPEGLAIHLRFAIERLAA